LQVNGKILDRLEVSPNISDGDLEKLAMENSSIASAIKGAEIKKIITRPPKLVNIVI